MALKDFAAAAIRLHQSDDVAVLKQPVRAGDTISDGSLEIPVAQNIGPGHKFALRDIANGAPVRKYGQIIGFAKGRIAAGEHVHTHNLECDGLTRDHEFCTEVRPVDYYPPEQMRTFLGYARPGG